ncbi:hypothetical protein AXG93_4461s1550 [Marchantia polymorpha subsp. ruderalis]|uniref:Uncharacterized protein n=1 Tax=Marchantia polymorpha subsp. ruderalis TaxID=1480154 RepID=A0A176WQS3_MARPO|nr:hypothetical protein AXG93_4461s1550 [Marchantia polymorpha subsp. ruderalis]
MGGRGQIGQQESNSAAPFRTEIPSGQASFGFSSNEYSAAKLGCLSSVIRRHGQEVDLADPAYIARYPLALCVTPGGGFEGEDEKDEQAFVIRDHDFSGMVLHVREFSFHQVNANLLWPGAVLFAEWIVEHHKLLEGRKVLELGSGTGALAIFLTKKYGLDVTTSDYDDVEIENNIKLNCELNELSALPHIRHTWGDVFPEENPQWDLIIASDILLYVKQYANLITTLSYLFRKYEPLKTAEDSSVGVNLQELDAPEVERILPQLCMQPVDLKNGFR